MLLEETSSHTMTGIYYDSTEVNLYKMNSGFKSYNFNEVHFTLTGYPRQC